MLPTNPKKKMIIGDETSFKKSNKLSMAKLNMGLSKNQMQLFAFAIYSTPDENTGEFFEFSKSDFEERFSINNYKTKYAFDDSDKLTDLKFSLDDLKNNKFDFAPIFSRLKYENGVFYCRWNVDFLPHILDLKGYYLTVNLAIVCNFKSSFSWILYDYLKAHYSWFYKTVSKEELMNLFCVEDKKTYITNTAKFKQSVLDVAVDEINKYTELQVKYYPINVGRTITGFRLEWTREEIEIAATEEQIRDITGIVDFLILQEQSKYLDVSDDDLRKRAIYLYENNIKPAARFIEEVISSESAITFKKAKSMLSELRGYVMELDNIKRNDNANKNTNNSIKKILDDDPFNIRNSK